MGDFFINRDDPEGVKKAKRNYLAAIFPDQPGWVYDRMTDVEFHDDGTATFRMQATINPKSNMMQGVMTSASTLVKG